MIEMSLDIVINKVQSFKMIKGCYVGNVYLGLMLPTTTKVVLIDDNEIPLLYLLWFKNEGNPHVW